MKLELHRHKIKRVEFGSKTKIETHTLFIDKKELADVILETSGFKAEVVICRPGDSVRITNVLDIVQPRIKSEGDGQIFPGFIGSSEKVGNGLTKILEGVAVVEVAAIPRVQEGLIDMAGNGAKYSPFSQTHNIVLCFNSDSRMEVVEFDQQIRLSGLKASTYLAKASLQNDPDESQIFELSLRDINAQKDSGLNRIGYIYMLQSQGLLRNTFLYGASVGDLPATLVHPNEIMDGTIVSGNYVIPSNRNPTYFHLNNPIIHELYRRHNHNLLFCGVVLCNEYSALEEKEKTADDTVEMLKTHGIEGAIITKEGGGNADTDLMLMCQACEANHIQTVLIGNEAAGMDGADPSLTHVTSEADAVVTTGNNDEPVELGPVERLIGQGALPGISGDLKRKLIIPVGRINGATNLLGYNTLSSKAY